MESNMIPAKYNHTKEQQWWDSIHNHAELCIKHNIKAATSCYTIPFADIQKIYELEHSKWIPVTSQHQPVDYEGWAAIVVEHNKIKNIYVEKIKGAIPYFYATKWCPIYIPEL